MKLIPTAAMMDPQNMRFFPPILSERMPKRGWLKEADNMRTEARRLARVRVNPSLSMSSGRSAARKGG
jgi:hypothetical protein